MREQSRVKLLLTNKDNMIRCELLANIDGIFIHI